MRITIACPEALVPDANQFARALGQSAADGETFGPADWCDAAGNAYALASGVFSDGFPAAAQAPLVAPPWGADLTAAARAQAALAIGAAAAPDRLAAVISEDIPAALAVLGVTRIEDPTEEA